MRRILLSIALTVCSAALGLSTAGAAHAAAPSCTGTVQVVSSGFTPSSASPGQTATASVVLQDCTGQSQQDSVMWYGRFTAAGTTFPAGCPALDPLVLPAAIPASGQATSSVGYLVPAPCTATDLQVTATVRGPDGSTLATATADLAIAPGACRVRYVRQSEWSGGFVAAVTIANDAATALNGWRLVFTFGGDQRVTGAWGATVTQTGSTLTAVNLSWNASVPAGGTVTFGLQGTWHTSDAAPGGYQLNGHPCTPL